MVRRRVIGTVVVLLSLASGTLSCAATDVAPRSPERATSTAAPSVTGYLLDGEPNSLVDREAGALEELGVDGVTLYDGGRRVHTPSAGAVRLLKRGHTKGRRAELLVSNFSDKIGDFDTRAGATLLRHDANIDRVVDRLVGIVRDQGWDGITVDLESLRTADAAGLVRLVRQLQARMPARKTVSIDLMAATSIAGYRGAGYALRPLGKNADVVAVMTYDDHGPGWSGPGPIGPLSWQRDAVETLLRRIPADRIDLGVAGYGYGWPLGKQGSHGIEYTVAEARAAAGDLATWRPTVGEWTATLPDGTVMWWSDRRSYDLRHQLAEDLGLHGLALWRLGSADPLG